MSADAHRMIAELRELAQLTILTRACLSCIGNTTRLVGQRRVAGLALW